MFNVGGAELLVICLVALIVLGPDKLPEAARKIGQFMGQMRQYSAGFQNELRNALDEPIETKARERGAKVARPAATDPTSDDMTSEDPTPENPTSETGPSTNGVSKPLAKPVRSTPVASDEEPAEEGTSRTRSSS